MFAWKVATIIFCWLFLTLLFVFIKFVIFVGSLLEPLATMTIKQTDDYGAVDIAVKFDTAPEEIAASGRKGFWVEVSPESDVIIEWTPPEE